MNWIKENRISFNLENELDLFNENELDLKMKNELFGFHFPWILELKNRIAFSIGFELKNKIFENRK